jgi:hypothetical protein
MLAVVIPGIAHIRKQRFGNCQIESIRRVTTTIGQKHSADPVVLFRSFSGAMRAAIEVATTTGRETHGTTDRPLGL